MAELLGLLLLTSALDQFVAAIEAFFFPKVFWDFVTKTLDPAVKPIPVLQVLNLIFAVLLFAWEWPLGLLAGSAMHRSIEARLVVIPLAALSAALLYQATNPAIYYVIALVVYFWAYSEGEVCLFPRTRRSGTGTPLLTSEPTDDLGEAVDPPDPRTEWWRQGRRAGMMRRRRLDRRQPFWPRTGTVHMNPRPDSEKPFRFSGLLEARSARRSVSSRTAYSNTFSAIYQPFYSSLGASFSHIAIFFRRAQRRFFVSTTNITTIHTSRHGGTGHTNVWLMNAHKESATRSRNRRRTAVPRGGSGVRQPVRVEACEAGRA